MDLSEVWKGIFTFYTNVFVLRKNNSENTFTSANTPTKTFDEILESNKDVLERIKEKGD